MYNWKLVIRNIIKQKKVTLLNVIGLSFGFTFVIFVSCLGLFGLLSFISETRIKEIGIRKVNGAKMIEILQLLNKDIVIWIGIAFLFAVPITWISMNNWLNNFAYITNISWWIFLAGGILLLLISLLTVSIETCKAASRNPAEALKYE